MFYVKIDGKLQTNILLKYEPLRIKNDKRFLVGDHTYIYIYHILKLWHFGRVNSNYLENLVLAHQNGYSHVTMSFVS